MSCLGAALSCLLPNETAGLNWLQAHGLRWLHALMSAEDLPTCAAAFHAAAALAATPHARARLITSIPETLEIAAHAALDVASPHHFRAAALRLLLALTTSDGQGACGAAEEGAKKISP